MRRYVKIFAWIGSRIGKPAGFERVVRFFVPLEKCGDLPEVCLVRDGSLIVTRLGHPLGWHLAFFGSYEPELREIVRTVLPSGGVAIDIGANVGWHTLLMARLVGAEGRVLAIEANPSVREHLERNVKFNRLGQVEVVPFAIAESERHLDFHGPNADDPASASGHVSGRTEEKTGLIRVKARSLDSIVEERRIARVDLIKIDVEGFEWPALQGGEETITRFRPYIVFEYDSAYARRGGGSTSVLAEFLQMHRYRLFAIGRNWAEALDGSAWSHCGNILAAPL